MKMLVTGGAGFIGSHFIELLYNKFPDKFAQITVLDNLTYAGKMENLRVVPSDFFQFIYGDITDSNLVVSLVSKSDLVVNFAAESHVDNSINDAGSFVSTNIIGTYNVLEALKKHPNCRLIQISTDEVYGSIKKGSWSEDSPIQPNSPYSATKASADILALAFAKTFDLDILITRCSNNFGIRQFPEKLIPFFVSKILNGEKVTLYGDGSNIRDWIHVEDHCLGIMAAVERGVRGNVYNLGGGTELTNLDLTNRILSILEKDGKWINFVPDRKGHDFRYSVSTKKAEKELGWSPRRNFHHELINTVNWLKERY